MQVEAVSLVQTKANQWLAEISIFKSAKEDFTTTLTCLLHAGVISNVISLDDLSVITQLGDPPMNTSSVKLKLFSSMTLKLFSSMTLKPFGECN